MNVIKTAEGDTLTIALEGRLDTVTAPQLDQELKQALTPATRLVLDLAGLEYLSSAGLRVLLSARKKVEQQGSMVLRHVNRTILEVFEVTGFADFLTIQAD